MKHTEKKPIMMIGLQANGLLAGDRVGWFISQTTKFLVDSTAQVCYDGIVIKKESHV